ncbi:MAG: HIT family protein [Chloroflexi bacterium HGW-Chloroflexi-4]|jgi:diadenosine tetraphosphate (Ap4A) HIT family hydrolase|nr:MAG: HIT family protein [Chloroflexi bacterium HGW-Chloroflexi-7]PKN99478.1 MAG: HIT family protein [Chloroflexi bacterium HGW-Chloroflexi-4]
MDNNIENDCVICHKHRGELKLFGGFIHEDDLIAVSHSLLWGEETTHYLGHIFIESKRHVPEYAELTDEEAQRIGLYIKRVSNALLNTLDVDHVYSFMFVDGVPHIHVHVIGRYRGAPREYWGSKVDEWPDAPKGSEEELTKLTSLLRQYMIEHI